MTTNRNGSTATRESGEDLTRSVTRALGSQREVDAKLQRRSHGIAANGNGSAGNRRLVAVRDALQTMPTL